MNRNRNAEKLGTVHTHTHTSTFRKIIIGISIVIILFVTIELLIIQQNKSIVLADNQIKKIELQDNEYMHLEIDSTGDKMPVPNGYVGSKATGENEIDTGYVIYEGTEEVNDSNVEEAQKTRNQYVWIPVPDVSKMYGTDANGKKWGKLYEFTTGTGENINPVTGARPLNWRKNNGVIEITNKNSNREPDVLSATNKPPYDTDSILKKYNISNNSNHNFFIKLEQEFYSIIESVKKYGGFYIGRYETGDLSKETVVVKKGNIDIRNQTWYTMYNKCKRLSGSNTNIETGMIWGSQWDRTLMWLIEIGNKSKEEICKDSTTWGNYKNATFQYIDEYGILKEKKEGISSIIPTGNAEYTKANNIYDLAGNVTDWTIESCYLYGRTGRGNQYEDSLVNAYASFRYSNISDSMDYRKRLSCNVIHKINVTY